MKPLLVLALGLTLACAACSTSPLTSQMTPDLGSPPDLTPALPEGISPLAGYDPSLPSDDLAPLGALIGDRGTVGIGESIHTSGGFQLSRARVIEYLVEQKHFRLIAIEWQRASGDAVEAYLQSGKGTAAGVAMQLSVWSSQEVEQLLAWLRTFNLAHLDDPVHFMGFDVQQPDVDVTTLKTFFTAAAPGDAGMLLPPLDKCDLGQGESTTGVSYLGDYPACTAGLDAIDAYFASHQAALTQASSADQLLTARVASTGLRAWQTEAYDFTSDVPASYQARDDAMAAVYLALKQARHPTLKTVVWAHNYHLRQLGAAVTGDGAVGAPTMGTRLAAALGDDYFPVAQLAYDVGIDWPNVGCGPQPPADAASMPGLLNTLPIGAALVDLASPFFQPGQSYGESDYESMIPAQQYRAIIFLKHSPKMTPLDWPSCQ
jgi:erythromycin esterase-like protein